MGDLYDAGSWRTTRADPVHFEIYSVNDGYHLTEKRAKL